MGDNKSSRLSKINLFLIAVMSVIFLFHTIEQDIINYEINYEISESSVDFSVPEIQNLSDGFMLGKASQEKHLTGIKFKGRIINTQSVDHHNATFKLYVNGQSKKFTINKISSGNSTSFDVYVPDLSADSAQYAKIKYIASTVSFRTK